MDNKLFNDLKEIQKLLWKDDDLMNQDILFEIQEKFSQILLENSTVEQQKELLKEFKWLYMI